MIQRIYKSWAVRHVHPGNYALHVLGIPMAVAGVVFWFGQQWLWGTFWFVLGYLLQYIGHRIEGNEVGEWTLIKKIVQSLFKKQERV